LRDKSELEVTIGPSRNLNDLFAQLDKQEITVISLRNKANRLEELFMRLVNSKQNDDKKASRT
jgi:ABC-2 type transport system ATP-binding protein